VSVEVDLAVLHAAAPNTNDPRTAGIKTRLAAPCRDFVQVGGRRLTRRCYKWVARVRVPGPTRSPACQGLSRTDVIRAGPSAEGKAVLARVECVDQAPPRVTAPVTEETEAACCSPHYPMPAAVISRRLRVPSDGSRGMRMAGGDTARIPRPG